MLYDQTKHKERKNFCETCLWGFSRKELLDAHKPDCLGNSRRPEKPIMPEPGTTVEFKNYHKQLKAPFAIYADFECLLVPIQGAPMDPEKSTTRQTHIHKACSYSYIVVRSDGKSKKPVVYRGSDAAEKLLEDLQKEAEELVESLKYSKKAIINAKVRREYDEATICHICEEPLNGDKVLDHDHITGLYRGAAHNKCNLKLRIDRYKLKIPVIFHNLRGYDSHLLMQAIGKVSGNITCIPNNTEKYISFSIGNLRFIDSAQFLIASLDKLVSSTPPEAFKITSVNESDAAKKNYLLVKAFTHTSTWILGSDSTKKVYHLESHFTAS